jgi:hypothetical protein
MAPSDFDILPMLLAAKAVGALRVRIAPRSIDIYGGAHPDRRALHQIN